MKNTANKHTKTNFNEQEKKTNSNEPQHYTAICQRGLENVLADELQSLGAEVTEVSRSAVIFNGNNEILYKANMAVRSAVSILRPLKRIIAHDYDMLYFQQDLCNPYPYI